MFAVVDVAGRQVKVSPQDRIFVPKMKDKVGSTVKLGNVLLVADDSKVSIGTPLVKSIAVEAKILGHTKDETVMVFKKKRRKGYRVRRGHRQQYTEIEIVSIGK